MLGFFIGLMIGGAMGVFTLALVQINKEEE